MHDSGKRTCTKCGIEKPLDESPKKNPVRYLSHCKECSRAYIRNHYSRNKEYYLQKARLRNKILIDENRARIFEYLSHHPCVDCGESDPRVLEFDHVTGTKKKDIARMVRENEWFRIEEEIAKCVVRCANCHRRHSHQSRGWWKNLNRSKPA